MLTTLLSLIYFALIQVGLGVDRGKFKTCLQSGFCKRQRVENNSTLNSYQILPESIKPTKYSLHFDIRNNYKGTILKSILSLYENNIIRFEIDDTLVKRYKSNDALLPNLPPNKEIQLTHQAGLTLLTFNNHKIYLNYDPFKLTIFQDDQKIIGFNENNLFNFEQSYDEKDEEDSPLSNLAEKSNATEVKATFSKEENFDGHTDTKPYGDTSIGIDLKFFGLTHLYGIPEHADGFLLESTKDKEPYRLYNFDVFEYELLNKMALYGSIPYMIGHSPSHTLGVFWNNPSEMWIDIDLVDNNVNSETHWMTESGILDLFITLGPDPAHVFQQYALITGTTPLPPISTLGYHQSRWNYNSETDVKEVLDKFDEYDIPLDFIWLDIEHTDGKRYFTWDPLKFANPLEMVNYLKSKGRKLVTIVDPHIKLDDNYKIYSEANAKDKFYIQTREKKDFEGWCWPGTSKYPDFVRPEVRAWWASKFAFNEYIGTTEDVFVWNDMNEPSVFNGPEVTMPKDCLHLQDTIEHRDVHNIYGMYVHGATYQGLLERSNGKVRPFVLSRAFFAGSQRTTSVWTGDNTAEWGHLKISVPMALSLSITGMTFCGSDIGGFFKNPSQDLLMRWYQAAAFQPFFRAHAHIDTTRREPYLFDNIFPAIKNAIYERYTYIPFWYTLFYESEKSGMPVMRPLWVEFPKSPEVFNIDNQHMIGNALLVHPVTDENTQSINVYLPGPSEVWYNVYTGEQISQTPVLINQSAIEHIGVYQRGGTIIPRKMRLRRSSTISNKLDPYTLYIALDANNQAKGTLYIDDGISYEYRNGHYIYAQFEFKENVLQCDLQHSNFETTARYERFVISGIKRPKHIVNPSQRDELIHFVYRDDIKELTVKNPVKDVTSNWKLFFKF